MGHDADATAAPEAAPRPLRIQEVAAETGLTPRSIRYYEEMGLLSPVARSEGAYRLYDADDLERLRFIAALRNDAGFSLAEIGQLLEDEQARARNRDRFRQGDVAEQRAAILDAIIRIDRQIHTLERKRARIDAMLDDARTRRAHNQAHLDALEAGRAPDHAPHVGAPLANATVVARPTKPKAAAR